RPRRQHLSRRGRRIRALRRTRGSRQVVNTHPRPAAQSPSSAPADADSDGTVEPSWPLTTWQGWHRFATTDPPPPPPPPGPPADAASAGPVEPSWPLTPWQGWHRFATTGPPAPPQPGDPPRSTDERLAYHSAFVTIRTPAISQLATQVRTLMILGRHQQTTAR